MIVAPLIVFIAILITSIPLLMLVLVVQVLSLGTCIVVLVAIVLRSGKVTLLSVLLAPTARASLTAGVDVAIVWVVSTGKRDLMETGTVGMAPLHSVRYWDIEEFRRYFLTFQEHRMGCCLVLNMRTPIARAGTAAGDGVTMVRVVATNMG